MTLGERNLRNIARTVVDWCSLSGGLNGSDEMIWRATFSICCQDNYSALTGHFQYNDRTQVVRL